MEAVFLKLVNMSITASWLVLAVLVLRLVLKKAPRWMLCALWGLVALRLICPFSIESALSLIPSGEPLPQEIIYTASPEIQSGIAPIDNAVNPVLSEALAPANGASANPTQIWSFILSHVWLIGMAAMLLYALGSFLLLKRRMATATLLRENIKQSELADSPFVLGLFRPTIYLPYAMSEADMAHVIAHEQAHIRRRDHWWKPLGFLLLSVYWFNPVLWLAYVLLCRDIEAACDEKVIADMEKDDRRAYSTALLNCSVHRRRIAACPLAFGEVGVKDRVKSVMNYKKPAFWIIAVAVIASIVVAVCFLTNPEGLRLDFSQNEIVSASCFDMRSGSDEHISKELNQAQIDELTSRLESLSGAKKSDRFAGLTAGYQISGKLENDTYIRVSGYALDRTGNVDIEWQGRRYVVTDQEFQAYLSRICGGDDVASAGEILAAVPATWVYAPMMSATWHAAFHFNFEMDYSHIEASCDEGEMWNLRALEAGQPHEKSLRFEAGQPVCWRPEIGGSLTDTTEAATVTFTVYDGGEILYTGTLDITRTAVENGMSLYEARLGGTDLLALRQEDGNMGAAVILAGSDAAAEKERVPSIWQAQENAIWFEPEDIHDIVYMELVWHDGQRFTPLAGEGYDYIQTRFSSAKEIGATGCPYHSVLYIHRSDGVVGKVLPAEDSCDVFQSDGKYYQFGDRANPPYYDSNETFYHHFGTSIEELPHYTTATDTTEQGSVEQTDDILLEKYADIDALPLLDLDVKDRYVFDDRVLLMEDTVDNELEQVVFEDYYYKSSAQFDQLMALVGENTSLQITSRNEEKNFNEGLYMSERVLHSLETLPAAAIQGASQYVKDDIAEKLVKHDLTAYAMVSVDISWKYNELYASMGPQLEEGRYMRYWLLGKTASDPEYKLYELYWSSL